MNDSPCFGGNQGPFAEEACIERMLIQAVLGDKSWNESHQARPQIPVRLGRYLPSLTARDESTIWNFHPLYQLQLLSTSYLQAWVCGDQSERSRYDVQKMLGAGAKTKTDSERVDAPSLSTGGWVALNERAVTICTGI